MQWISFDIECANSYQGRSKICSFGYVLADESFRVLEKKDLIINPKARFNPGMTKRGEVTLAYTKEEFKAAPDFAAVYPVIKDLLEAPDRLAVGHSVSNDVGYLRGECERYRLPQLEYDYIDAQTIHYADSHSEHVLSLDKIAAEFEIEFTAHKSDDDAYATMLYLQKICERNALTLPEIMEKYGIRAGHAGADPVGTVCSALAKPKKPRSLEKFVNYVRNNQSVVRQAPLNGLRVCFNLPAERKNLDDTLALIARMNAVGARYVAHARDCNLFVLPDDETARPCARQNSALIRASQGKKIDFMKRTEFDALLARTEANYLGRTS